MKIVCTSCQKPLSIDETKLPMREVVFPCPSCQAKLTVDRRTMDAVSATPISPAEILHEQPQYGKRALLAGVDDPAVRQAAKEIGYQIAHFPTAAAAREFYVQEYPAIVFLRPTQVTPPPLTEMGSLLSVSPVDRRRGFFILIADNLRSFDGNAAFVYNVNLIVAVKDLPSFPAIFHEANTYHERLYKQMNLLTKD